MTSRDYPTSPTETIRISRHVETGRVDLALTAVLEELKTRDQTEDFYKTAVSVWSTAAQRGGVAKFIGQNNAETLHKRLISQGELSTEVPILAHHIAAQHSAGQNDALTNASNDLTHTLSGMIDRAELSTNALVLALLLRAKLPADLQTRISASHKEKFQSFTEGQLRIPYSHIFDRFHFCQNILDLKALIDEQGENIFNGRTSLVHILLLLWTIPSSFTKFEAGWHLRAVAAREGIMRSPLEQEAARSLMVRYGGSRDPKIQVLHNQFRRSQVQVLSEVKGADDDFLKAERRLTSRVWQAANAARNFVAGTFPYVKGRRRPRVALCISGQLRGYRKAWPTWAPLLAGADVITFVHTWKKVGRGTAEPFRYNLPFEGDAFGEQYRKIGTQLGLSEMHRRYPSLFERLMLSGEVTANELSDFYHTPHVKVNDESDPRFADFSNAEKMYWKVEQCHQLMVKSGIEFDAVIRIRPDKPIVAVGFLWTQMLRALQRRPTLYTETGFGVHFGALMVGDQFAIGLPKASALYANTYSTMVEPMKVGLYKLEKYYSGHSTFAQACWLSQIEVRKAPIKFGLFQEAEAMPLHSIYTAIKYDARGRMDAHDTQFIKALEKDLQR